MKKLKKYKKPLLTLHGNIKEITQGAWGGPDDGYPTKGEGS